MPVFYVHLVGVGEGCDYCISCNETVKEIEAPNMEAAKTLVAEMLGGYGEPGIESATIIEPAAIHEFDVDDWRRKKEADAVREKAAREEEKQRQDYERLKARFEGGTVT